MRPPDIDLDFLRRTRRIATLQRRRAVLQRIWEEEFDRVCVSGRFFKLCSALDRCEEALEIARYPFARGPH